MREVRLPSERRIILSDTVGFISDLPTMLVAAFRATLEEVVEADLLLHVRDISHPEREAQRADVHHVLADLGVEAAGPEAKVLEVWNKIDALQPEQREEIENGARRASPLPVLVSARTGTGIASLLAAIDRRLSGTDEIVTLEVPSDAGALMHWLHGHTEVLDRRATRNGHVVYRVRIETAKRGRLAGQMKRAGLTPLPA